MNMYEVLKVEGKGGLTVGAESLPPGRKFSEKEWPYGEKSLLAAIENKRVRKIDGIEESKGEKAGNKKTEKALADALDKIETLEGSQSGDEGDFKEAKKALADDQKALADDQKALEVDQKALADGEAEVAKLIKTLPKDVQEKLKGDDQKGGFFSKVMKK